MSYSASLYVSTYELSEMAQGKSSYLAPPPDFMERLKAFCGHVHVGRLAFDWLSWEICLSFSGDCAYIIRMDDDVEREVLVAACRQKYSTDLIDKRREAQDVLDTVRAMRAHRVGLGLNEAEWWVA